MRNNPPTDDYYRVWSSKTRHLLSFLSNLHGVSKFSPLSTSLHCHVYRGPHDLSIAEMKKYNFLIRKKKKKKDRMANGTLPLSRLMRLQMAHMRRAQCCLSDFCSVSKVTMIDGYFWINNHFLLSLYAWKNIYIYIFVCIYINTRASKFHWTSSPVITDGNESSSPCFLQLNTLTNFEQSPVRGDTRGRALSSFTHYHSSSDFPHGHWLDDGIILFENSHRSWPPYDARRNPTICGSLQPSNLRIDTRTHLEESLVAREREDPSPLPAR